ncbi:MAG: hypothetical protein JRG96_17955 [Deltaproteobacteria bacterium]|nr:hypothetical protein [Deltaproteobacteria bacterium]MBW2417585.1 hypothetical protein [Deltaproteobacteria bacterium]
MGEDTGRTLAAAAVIAALVLLVLSLLSRRRGRRIDAPTHAASLGTRVGP